MDCGNSLTNDSRFSYIAGYIMEHRAELLRYANKLTHYSHDDAQDLFQETVYRSLHNVAMFRECGTTGAWLRTIMHNIYINDINRSTQHRTMDFNEIEVTDEALRPDECYSIGELYRAIEKLPPRDSMIITMRIQGYSYVEIADRLEMKEGTVKSAIHRIKVQLKSLLK